MSRSRSGTSTKPSHLRTIFTRIRGRSPKPTSAPSQAIVLADQTPNLPSNDTNAAEVSSAVPTRPKRADRNGLIALTQNANTDDPTMIAGRYPVDIVAVHGLRGDAFATFTSKTTGKLWLADFLPAEFPGARIYTYSYPAEILYSRDTSKLADYARGLLEGLAGERKSPGYERRPLIFICHSMGGIVVKKALNICVSEAKYYGDIRLSVQAIYFMATPHRGSDIAKLASLASGIGDIFTLGSTRTDLLSSLRIGSEELGAIAREFRMQTSDMMFVSFIEQKTIFPLKKRIVDDLGGSLDVSNEIVVPMSGCTHIDICQFDETSDSGYKLVLGRLRMTVLDATTNVIKKITAEEEPCFQSLYFPSMMDRRQELPSAHPETCTWILRHVLFKSWEASEHDTLWIKGYPGTGKSVMMAFVHNHLRRPGTASYRLVLEFFFHGNGNSLQKSQLGLFRSLLHQICLQSLKARAIVVTHFKQKTNSTGTPGQEEEWQLGELKALLLETVKEAADDKEVVILIDALDEAMEFTGNEETKTAQAMIDMLHDMQQGIIKSGSRLKICISCRHYPVAGNDRSLQISMEEENASDVRTYVLDYLRRHILGWEDEKLEHQDFAVEAILQKAAGQFLWASIRVPQIVKSVNDGLYLLQDIGESIRHESNEISALYKNIILSINLSMQQRAFTLMQWICLVARPLSLVELRWVMTFNDSDSAQGQWSSGTSNQFIKSDMQMQKLTASLSGGLAVVKYHNENGKLRNSVQLIHQTVREFFLITGLAMLETNFASPLGFSNRQFLGSCHDRISTVCIMYLRLGEVVDAIEGWSAGDEADFVFVDYATRYWTTHAERADQLEQLQLQKIDHLQGDSSYLRSWITSYRNIDSLNARCPKLHSQLIHVGALFNLWSVVANQLEMGVSVAEIDGENNTPLHLAARWSNISIVRLILHNGADVEAIGEQKHTPLLMAARIGRVDVVSMLIEHGACVDGYRNLRNDTSLHLACFNGDVTLVNFLIRMGADINFKGGSWGSALQAAAIAQSETIVRHLVELGADVNAQAGEFDTALQAAIAQLPDEKSLGLIHYLLDKGADVNLQGGFYGTCLQAATNTGGLDLVALLLRKGANVNAEGGFAHTALQLAASAQEGKLEMVEMLLDHGANINAKGGYWGSALQAAASAYHGDKIVRILLDRGADITHQDGMYGNVLLTAAYGGNVNSVKMLLAHGCDVNSRGGHHSNVLATALQGPCPLALFDVLLNHGADVQAIELATRRTPLVIALTTKVYVAKYLLDRDLKIEDDDAGVINRRKALVSSNYGAALRAAASSGLVESVKLLLERGKHLPTSEDCYIQAFQGAIDSGHRHIIQYLFENEIGRALNLNARNQVVRMAGSRTTLAAWIRSSYVMEDGAVP